VAPMIIFGSNTWHNNIAFRLNAQNPVSKDLSLAQGIFSKYNPGYPFEYKFADEQYNKKFGDNTRTVRLAGIFAGLTIFISCLGLFGLAAFMAENRSKEIGIRKVLGASIGRVVESLTKEFAALVMLAFLIAVPASWWIMNKWLQDFTYRIDIHWWTLTLAGLLAMTIALLTVSFHAIKAALANPVKSLRTE
jgi:putative ABC transport system permease protein